MSRQGIIFLDRDGVINEDIDYYVTNWNEFVFRPRIFDILKMLKKRNIKVAIVTNQSCIGKGILSINELEKIHQNMIDEINKNEGEIETIYCCPHRSEDNCICRKPNIFMFKKAEQDLNISLLKSIMVGNRSTDITAGFNAGCRTVLVLTNESMKYGAGIGPHFIAKDMNVLFDILDTQTKKWK